MMPNEERQPAPAPADDALDAAARELIERRDAIGPWPTSDVLSDEMAWIDRDNKYYSFAHQHAAAVAQLALDRGAALRAERERVAELEELVDRYMPSGT